MDGPIYIAEAWTHVTYLSSEQQKADLAVLSMPGPVSARKTLVLYVQKLLYQNTDCLLDL